MNIPVLTRRAAENGFTVEELTRWTASAVETQGHPISGDALARFVASSD